MAEYRKEQKSQQSRSIANIEPRSRQLKEIVDNREKYLQLRGLINFHSNPIQRVIKDYDSGPDLTDEEIEVRFSKELKNPMLKEKIEELKAIPKAFTVAGVKAILTKIRLEPGFVETLEEDKVIGYDPLTNMDILFQHYTSIGGELQRGQLETVCNKAKKPGGHYTNLKGELLEMKHDSHGPKSGKVGESASAWKLSQNGRVVGVGFHLNSDTYTAVFPNTDHAQARTCNAQIEVKQMNDY